MGNQTYNQIVSFILGIAGDCLQGMYVCGKYRDVTLSMPSIFYASLQLTLNGASYN